jgi:hypothetical protein
MPKDAPIAIMEAGVRPPVRERVTQYGKPISLTKTIQALDHGASFRIDHPRHRNIVYVIAKKCKKKVSTYKTKDGMLLVTLKNADL